ncbi:MAG: hypothetical protein ACK55Z_36885, partial [bacterium]
GELKLRQLLNVALLLLVRIVLGLGGTANDRELLQPNLGAGRVRCLHPALLGHVPRQPHSSQVIAAHGGVAGQPLSRPPP